MPDVSIQRLAREARKALALDPPSLPERWDPDYATVEELDRLCEILDEAKVGDVQDLAGAHREEFARILAAIEERREHEPAWTPPLTPELLSATREARAEGGTVLPVSDGLHVRFSFDPDGAEPDPEPVEPEPLPLDLLPKLEEEARERKAQAAGQPQGTKSLRPGTDDETGRSDEKAASLVGGGRPERPDSFAPAVFTWRSQRSRPREGSAAEIFEREF